MSCMDEQKENTLFGAESTVFAKALSTEGRSDQEFLRNEQASRKRTNDRHSLAVMGSFFMLAIFYLSYGISQPKVNVNAVDAILRTAPLIGTRAPQVIHDLS